LPKKDENRKVITQPRGIFTKPSKKGKFADAFFSNMTVQDKKISQMEKEMADKERAEYLTLVQTRKKGSNGAAYKATFKPGGPQEYKDLYI
jgi:hypothetical protein